MIHPPLRPLTSWFPPCRGPPVLIVTKKAVPANNLKELIAWLKTNQDKVSVGTSGVGGTSHVAGVFLQNS
jgi:tripartite-type tricarboxylate transporter receptor subunit TctC